MIEALKRLDQVTVLTDEPLANHTTFKIGGPAKALVLPHTEQALQAVMNLVWAEKVKYYILGNGSNVLFEDEGYDGIVVKIADNLSQVKVEDNRVYAQAGALLSKVAKEASRQSLSGLEFATGIPGTIGGGVAMNAGAYGGEMKDVITGVTLLTPNGELIKVQGKDMHFGYRKSLITERDYIAVAVEMELRAGDYHKIWEKIEELDEKRTTKQPLHLPSAGSTFKRPTGYYAGKLIQDAGLKGVSFGGAMVSDQHSGFIVSYQKATGQDVRTLIKLVQKRVYESQGVYLEPEVKIIGK